MAKVALTKGVVRYDNVFRSLGLIQKDVGEKIGSSRLIVVKPDLLHVNGCSELELSNVDASKALLDFLEESSNKKVAFAEGSFSSEDVFHHHGFHDLLRDYSVRFINLNNDDSTQVKAGNASIPVSDTLLKADLRISLAVLKRDHRLGMLGAIPNMLVGSVAESDKDAFYGSRDIAKGMPELYKLLKPHLAVIDGFDAIKTERNVKMSAAVAGANAVAADTVAARILGIRPWYLAAFPASSPSVVTL